MKTELTFNPQTGGKCSADGSIVWFIPWEDDNKKFYLWDITVRHAGSMHVIHTEVFCKDIPILKMYDIAVFLIHHPGITPDEVKKYIRSLLKFKQINVYKMVISYTGEYTYILETSKMASKPVIHHPGSRKDENC